MLDANGNLKKGNLTFEIQWQRLVLGGVNSTLIPLTPIEFRLLLCLAQSEGQVLSRAHLMQTVWGQEVHIVARAIDTHLCNVRRKISASEFTVKSVRGVGYTFQKKETVQQAPTQQAA